MLQAKGVMHNDISPDNVTVSRDASGRVVFHLVDGGAATMHDPGMSVMALDHYWEHPSPVASLYYSSSQAGSSPSHAFTARVHACVVVTDAPTVNVVSPPHALHVLRALWRDLHMWHGIDSREGQAMGMLA